MKQKGFTLMELLILIAILGVIAAVVALNVGNFFNRGGDNVTTNETDRIIIGELSSLDWLGEYTRLYFHDGPNVVVDSYSLADALNTTDPFDARLTYNLHEAGQGFAGGPYYTVLEVFGLEVK